MARRWNHVSVALILMTALEAHAEVGQKWRKNMQTLAQTLGDLIPEVVSEGPTSPVQRKRIEKLAEKLLQVSHGISMGNAKSPQALPPDADPSVSFISSLFEREIKHGYNSIKQGHVEYGKSTLRMVSGYCIACHTRTDMGPEFPVLPLSPKVDRLEPFQKAQVFAATRQFDRALSVLDGIISNEKMANTRQIEWARAVRQSLNIAVRVKKDPAKAESILKLIQTSAHSPSFFQEYRAGWLEAVNDWKKESPRKIDSEDGLFNELTRLMDLAKKMQKFPLDHSADILYLRASATAHELLSQFPHGKRASESFLALGTTYEVLDDRWLFPFPQMAYESCIRKSPHTSVAFECFQRFEQNIFLGFSGSGGTSIPDDLEKLIKELKVLAMRQK